MISEFSRLAIEHQRTTGAKLLESGRNLAGDYVVFSDGILIMRGKSAQYPHQSLTAPIPIGVGIVQGRWRD